MFFKVVMLAGGLGTRIKAVSNGKPKCLIDVNGRPFLDLMFDYLSQYKISEVIVCVGTLAEQIHAFTEKQKRNFKITLVEDGVRLLDTGGAIINALPWVQEDFIVLYGDSLLQLDLDLFYKVASCGEAECVMSVFKNKNQFDKSNIKIRNGCAIYDKENPQEDMEYIDYGALYFRKSFFDEYTLAVPINLTNILSPRSYVGEVGAYEASDRFFEIGSEQGLKELQSIMKQNGL